MIQLLVVDDHVAVRRRIEEVVSETGHIRVRGQTGSGLQAVEMARSGSFDAVVLDLSLPDLNGLNVLCILKREHSGLPVVVLSMHSEQQYIERCLRFGASGYLTKERAADELVAAIERAVLGTRSAERGTAADSPTLFGPATHPL